MMLFEILNIFRVLSLFYSLRNSRDLLHLRCPSSPSHYRWYSRIKCGEIPSKTVEKRKGVLKIPYFSADKPCLYLIS